MSKVEQVAQAAKELIKEVGLVNMTRSMVCNRAGISDGSFHYITGQTFTEYVAVLAEDAEMELGPVTRKRIDPKMRRDMILLAAVNVAREEGLGNVTRSAVAAEANVSDGLVTSYFSTMKQLRRAVMRYAIQHEVLEIVAQGVVAKDPQAMKAPESLRTAALAAL